MIAVPEHLRPPAVVAELRDAGSHTNQLENAVKDAFHALADQIEQAWESRGPLARVSQQATAEAALVAWQRAGALLRSSGFDRRAEEAASHVSELEVWLAENQAGNKPNARGVLGALRNSFRQASQAVGLGDPFDPQRALGGDDPSAPDINRLIKVGVGVALALTAARVISALVPLVSAARAAQE